jgi:putative transposase
LGVSHSGYYKWLNTKPSARSIRNEQLLAKIKSIYSENRFAYGSPRIHAILKQQGTRCGLGLVEKLMSNHGIFARKKKAYHVTTDSNHEYRISKNLLQRNFSIQKPNKVWASDVTYLWTKEGWLYLAVTLDLFSRLVIGWCMSKSLDAKLAEDSLEMAVATRKPSKNLIHHSDRGREFASHRFRAALKTHQIIQSMSRKADCWDNAVVESFFKTLKAEIGTKSFNSRREAEIAVFDWIEVFYNRQRIHSTLGYLSPAVYEAKAS